jgi:MFS family permease
MNITSLAKSPPTRVRYRVLGFACALSMITYLDRVCMGSAVRDIVDAFGLRTEADLNLVLTAFTFAYAAFEVPSGWLGDVYGPRRTLIRIVLIWSTFTALTGSVTAGGFLFLSGMATLTIVRFFFGLGEAGAYPNITRALHNWFPRNERGWSQGMVWMSGRFMGGITPVVWLLLVDKGLMSWRWAFWIFGLLGLIWCSGFAFWFYDRPEQDPSTNDSERELIGRDPEAAAGHARVPWGRFLRSGNLWALCFMYFCGSYGWYFNITYLPSFIERQMKIEPQDPLGALYKGGPLLLGSLSCLLGGSLSDWFIRRTGNRRWGRRLFGLVGHGLCALCYVVCIFTFTSDAWMFALPLSLAAFWNDLTMGSAWATCQDIGRRYAAIVAGCMNTIGNLGGAAAVWLTGEILKYYLNAYAAAHETSAALLSGAEKNEAQLPGYRLSLILYTLAYCIAVLLWLRIDSTTPVVPDEDEAGNSARLSLDRT